METQVHGTDAPGAGKSPSQLTLQLGNYTFTETKRRPSHATTIDILTILMVRESNTVESLALK